MGLKVYFLVLFEEPHHGCFTLLLVEYYQHNKGNVFHAI